MMAIFISLQISVCDTNPCKNGGTCAVDGSSDGYTCTCATGYFGVNCTVSIIINIEYDLTGHCEGISHQRVEYPQYQYFQYGYKFLDPNLKYLF